MLPVRVDEATPGVTPGVTLLHLPCARPAQSKTLLAPTLRISPLKRHRSGDTRPQAVLLPTDWSVVTVTIIYHISHHNRTPSLSLPLSLSNSVLPALLTDGFQQINYVDNPTLLCYIVYCWVGYSQVRRNKELTSELSRLRSDHSKAEQKAATREASLRSQLEARDARLADREKSLNRAAEKREGLLVESQNTLKEHQSRLATQQAELAQRVQACREREQVMKLRLSKATRVIRVKLQAVDSLYYRFWNKG